MRVTRRRMLGASGAGALAIGLESLGLGFFKDLAPVSAEQARLEPKLVRLDSSIEPVVRLVEETSRERLLEEIAGRIQKGLSYREVLSALLLAGVRNVQPRPAVGFKFHAVLVVNSAHLASLASSDGDRWLPIFWALDYFKSSQAATVKESGWRMGPADEAKVPGPERAAQAFAEAMDHWDEPAADAAAAGLARGGLARQEVFELFARYAARDFRDIGHKVIYVANSFRLLEVIGWHHAEAVLRSLAYALLKRESENPTGADLAPDRPWKRNAERAGKLKADWFAGKPDDKAAAELLASSRRASAEDLPGVVAEMLDKGVAPQSIWDGLLCGAGELLMRKRGIVALHAVTSANAIRYCWQATGSDELRRRLLLQEASFLALFRDALGPADKLPDVKIDEVEAAAPPEQPERAVTEIFAGLEADRMGSARKTLAYLRAGQRAEDLMHAARRLVFLKGSDTHDYKFSAAALEDYYHLSPGWRERFLAASMFNLRGTTAGDNALVARTRAALQG